jgi:hypothetical protein
MTERKSREERIAELEEEAEAGNSHASGVLAQLKMAEEDEG